jgi:CRISPR-associated protein Csd1
VLARDDSRGEGKSPLKNQLAIFWIKGAPEQRAQSEGFVFDLAGAEEMLVEAVTSDDQRAGPSPDPAHVNAFYGLPWSEGGKALHLTQNRFCVAALSPNKSRLVLREWIDTSLGHAIGLMRDYDDARTILSPDGDSTDRISVQAILSGLRPWKSRKSADDAALIRGLIRTAYLGLAPPLELLPLGVARFRKQQRPARREEADFKKWRQAQAAAIKIVLTYGKREAKTFQMLNNESRSGPHLCGELLSILEEAQLRASGWRINATLVDRFYGSASMAPSTTLGMLLKRATQEHMPKIRKAGLGYEELERTLEGVTTELDKSGGFPNTLTMREQGEFALGFYLRRAAFRAARPKSQVPTDDVKEQKQEKDQ